MNQDKPPMESKLAKFAHTWVHWTIKDNPRTYTAWSRPEQRMHDFTEQELNDIDPRIVRVLESPLTAHDEPDRLNSKLINSIFVWSNPNRTIKINNETIYWQSLVSIEDLGNGKAEIMFEAPLETKLIDGVLVASSETGMPNQEKTWDAWDKLLPNIKKYFDISQTLDMDEYDAANYCESMLFPTDKANSLNSNVALPSNIAP